LRLAATARQNAGLVASGAARRMEARFRALVQNASDLVALTDVDSRVRYLTPSAATFLGLEPEALVGVPLIELLHPDDAPKGRALLAEVSATPGATRRAEWRLRRADGSYCDTEMQVSNMLSVPEVGGLVLTARDIGDRKARRRLEVELSRVQRMEAIGQLAAGIAHDFNNLLTAASGYAQLVRDPLPTDDPRRSDLDEIVTATERGTVLVRQLLAFSRRQVLQPEVVDLNAIVEGIVPMLHRLLGEHIQLVSSPAAGLGHVRADPSQVEQIVVNLASNARDAMPGGGRLTIETANIELDATYAQAHSSIVFGPYIQLAVSDTGIGMDAETLAHMFEPFFTTKGPDRGTGLGLATVYGIVNQSGGHVWAYSEPGHGTTFKVLLPRIDEPASPAAEVRRATPIGGAETILLVEDEEAVRTYATRVLHRFGYRVVTAASPGEALALPSDVLAGVDLMVTDVIMPGHNGPELVARIAARAPALRVLYVSGYAEQSVIDHGLEQGAAFLAKPFGPEALALKVRELLDA
ncbi:MAG: ATP-binding protein, partial [Acidimicrobiales bacterium]